MALPPQPSVGEEREVVPGKEAAALLDEARRRRGWRRRVGRGGRICAKPWSKGRLTRSFPSRTCIGQPSLFCSGVASLRSAHRAPHRPVDDPAGGMSGSASRAAPRPPRTTSDRRGSARTGSPAWGALPRRTTPAGAASRRQTDRAPCAAACGPAARAPGCPSAGARAPLGWPHARPLRRHRARVRVPAERRAMGRQVERRRMRAAKEAKDAKEALPGPSPRGLP